MSIVNKLQTKTTLLLIVIVFIAAFLRFYQLGTNPPSLSWDEVSWGYNAYSLGIDGKDEFGRFLPHDYLESFGDFKPPAYAYLSILPVKIFGLNEFSTRFASAFFGTLTVLFSFFLTKNIFQKSKQKTAIAILAAGLLAISPWHIMLSRGAFEANVATFFIITGVWLFLEAIQRKPKLLLLSAIFFALSIYTFNSARIVAPILLIILAGGFYKQLVKQKKILALSIILGVLLMLPTVKFLFSPQASLRFKEVNIFSDVGIIKNVNQEIANDNNAWWSKNIHNRRFAYGREILKHYFDNLSPDFLFIKGDGNPRFSTGDVGQMYLFELPFLILGILFLIKRRESNWWIVPLWLLIGIIPASLARETPHALRIEGSLPTFQILTAYGIAEFLFWLRQNQSLSKKFSKAALSMLSLALFINVFYFLHGYYLHYPREQSQEWQYGYKDAVMYINSVSNNYDQIYFTTVLGRPYIYTLFYTKYDPSQFRNGAKIERDIFGFVHVESFDKFVFDKKLLSPIIGNKVLYIEDPKSIPVNAKIIKTFYLLNGKPIMTAYTL